jgi:hypothetical protein
MLNRSAIVVKPKQPFLDWLHTADPTSHRLTLGDLSREPTIYLIPECDTEADIQEVLSELCEEIFVEQMKRPGLEIAVSRSSVVGSSSDTIRCWPIYRMSR